MNQRRNRMAKKSRGVPKNQAKKPRAAVKNRTNLRQTLYGLGLWALGILNAILIASFVMKHISSGDEQVLSVDEKVPVVQNTAQLQVEVLNGCGVQGIAKKFADYLTTGGFEVANVDNFENFNMPTTLILDRKEKSKKNGARVAELLGLPQSAVLYQSSPDRSVDVSVIIGNDYSRISFEVTRK